MSVKIMLVDDNPTFLSAVRRFLAMLSGVRVIAEAHDGEEALVQAAWLRPDLVLLDIGLPVMNGLEVARRLQRWPQPPCIVFLSMHESSSYRDTAREIGVTGFVNKADFVVELLPIIEKLISEAHRGIVSFPQEKKK